MKGSRPDQAALSRDTDLSKTTATRAVIKGMVDGLNDHRINDIGEFFADGFRWMGNYGCGAKPGLKAFQDNWQRPFQAAFSDKSRIDEARIFMANGPPLSAGRKRRMRGRSWVCPPPANGSRSATWISVKPKTAGSPTIG